VGACINKLYRILKEIIKYLYSRESMVARLKFKGIDGRVPQGVECAAELTQLGTTYQVRI